ncbi:ABC transporter substrate-binding protein [Bradyrhizobium sp. 521_C7_N1_3]|uniref:ABC transporter substrate-binding protein n=1 Tax=Bradyrhizobium sp. 521_C7_N1_3 TaxID=3240368 RepID=UPI003F8C3B82
MTKQNTNGASSASMTRRLILQATASSLAMPLVTKSTLAWAEEKLAGSGEVVVQTFGGSYTEGFRRYVHDPFTKATGIKVVDVVADIADPQVMAMSRAGRVDWDIAQVSIVSYLGMHATGMFVPIDYKLWDQESLKGVPPSARLEAGALLYSTATVLAYDERAFPQGGPKNWFDFWDVKKFPGPRGLSVINPWRTLTFALVAAGVAPNNIWPLTDDKLDRAFEKLNEIKPHITKWWNAGGEPTQLLINREYAMTSVYDGRVLSAMKQGAPIKFIWDGADLAGSTVGVILKGSPNTGNAQKFIAFMNRAQIAAGVTQGTGYSAPNSHQLEHLPADLIPLLSVNPENAAKTIIEDSNWLAAKRADGKSNSDYIQERWLKWRTA